MKCAACDADIDDRDIFCSQCGELTQRGQPFAQQLGSTAGEIASGLTRLGGQASAYVRDETNRKHAVAGGVAVLLGFITLTNNPISASISGLFGSKSEGPQLAADGLPDFASYQDMFLSEEAEYVVTGMANVRDFPTSQGTTIIRTLNEGETVMAREVQAFDPSSQWMKLSNGGYAWGSNLLQAEPPSTQMTGEATASIEFAQNIRGTWSSMETCRGARNNAEVTITKNTMSFSESVGQLKRIETNEFGQPIYEVAFSSYYETWIDRMEISLTANGHSIIMTRPDARNHPELAYHIPDGGCEKVFFIE